MKSIDKITSKNKKLAVGLMSGTSLDGVDAALLEIYGSGLNTKVKLIGFYTMPYENDVKNKIIKLCSLKTARVDEICSMNVELGELMAKAALVIIEKCGKKPEDIDFISSHGQTIYHMPEKHATLQIGELAVIAARTGCVTIGDFRPSDMAVNGQGAPLVPYTDYLLFRSNETGRILLNIGGISNISVIKSGAQPEDVIAFDTGPGNMLIDYIIKIGTKGALSYDSNGEIARQGKVNVRWLEEILKRDSFIYGTPPKSTGRERYTVEFAEKLFKEGILNNIKFKDIIATVTFYTAYSIAYNIKKFVDPKYDIQEVIVSGGGVHNLELMKMLNKSVKQRVISIEDLNFSSDAKEAAAFAVLGNEFLHENYNNMPSATGAHKKVVMGKLVLP